MMSRLYRRFNLMLLLGVLALSSGLGSTRAATLVVTVDDTPANNGSVGCPATTNATIEAGILALENLNDKTDVTLNICPGNYTAPAAGFEFEDYNNLKIVGKGNPVITTPQNFTGFLLVIAFSRNVTVQGLTIDGHGWLGWTVPYGIYFVNSSGVIKENTITGWHQTYSGSPPYSIIGHEAIPIQVSAVPPGTQLRVTNNAVYDAQDFGISISSNYPRSRVKVSGNRVVLGSAIVPVDYPGPFRAQAGIAVRFSESGVEVSGNQILSDADLFPQTVLYSRGIMLQNSSGVRVTGNTVRGTAAQITIENWCGLFSTATTNNNIISGNRLYDTFNVGVYITARDDGDQICGTPHADFNQVKDNTIYALDLNTNDNPFGLMAVYLEAVGSGVIDSAVVKDNTFAGFGLAPNSYTVRADGTNVLNLIYAPNTILTLPPAGVNN
jgi:hypothetical protein